MLFVAVAANNEVCKDSATDEVSLLQHKKLNVHQAEAEGEIANTEKEDAEVDAEVDVDVEEKMLKNVLKQLENDAEEDAVKEMEMNGRVRRRRSYPNNGRSGDHVKGRSQGRRRRRRGVEPLRHDSYGDSSRPHGHWD